MLDLEMRLRVQAMVQQMNESFMVNNGVPASMMEDALTKVLLTVKEKAYQEFIDAVTAQQTAMQEAAQHATAQETTEVEAEDKTNKE